MKSTTRLATTICFAFMAALGVESAVAQTIIKMDGSSTVVPIAEAVAEEFQNKQRGKVNVTVGIAGTGGGFKRFCRGETDISDASRPILKEEMEACRNSGIKYMELPVAFDALTVVVKAAQARVMTWNQVRPEWPNQPLMLFGPGADSGTFDYFTEAVNGKAKASRGDFIASEVDNVLVQGVEKNANALGYFGFAYYVAHKSGMRAVPIVNGNGKAVGPSIEAVIDGSYEPLSRPLFIYISDKAAQRAEVKEFVQFFLQEGAALAKEVGYVPLPASAYQVTMKHFQNRKMGTVFGGVPEVGITINDLLAREGKL